MTNPVQPLTVEELRQQELEDLHQGWFHKDAVAFDQMVDVFAGGSPDETISSRMARWATEDAGFRRSFGVAVCAALNRVSADHGAKAEVADMTRGLEVTGIEASAPTVQESQ